MIRIGTAGWSIPKHHSVEFPHTGTHLERYSQILPCAEINSSFYRSHRLSTWEKWAAATPDNFRFSVKAPKSITHEAKLACSPEQLKIFLAEAKSLREKLGPILFQLPPKSAFNPTIAEIFFTILRDLHQGPVAFEPRNPTWFTPEANHLLQKFQIPRVATDPTSIPEAATAGGFHQLIYCRLHGSPRMYYSEYGKPYLQSLGTTIAHQLTTAEVWCIFDNTASGAALSDAHTLQQLISRPGSYQSPPAPVGS